MIERHKESISAAFFTIFSILYLFGERSITTTLNNGFGGSKFMPRLIGGMLLVFSVVWLLFSLRRELAGSDKAKKKPKPVNVKNVVLTFVFFALYVFAMGHLGFLISSFLYLTAQIYILSPDKQKRLLKSAGAAAAAAVVIYLLFVKGFSMMLPQGILVF